MSRRSSSRSSRSSQSSGRKSIPEERFTGEPGLDNPFRFHAYEAANYIRVLLNTPSDPTTDGSLGPLQIFPVGDFALHIILGLPYSERREIELVANTSNLPMVKKALTKADTEKHLLFVEDKSKDKKAKKDKKDRKDNEKETSFLLNVLTGNKLGGFESEARIKVRIHAHGNFSIHSALAHQPSYLEVVSATARYDFVETLGLTHYIEMLHREHKSFYASRLSTIPKMTPAVQKLCDIFYLMMDEGVQKRHSIAYTHREARKSRQPSPTRSPSRLTSRQKEMVREEHENIKNIRDQRILSLELFASEIDDVKKVFFERLYKYYQDNVLKGNHPQAHEFHNHTKAKADFFITSFANATDASGTETTTRVMPDWDKEAKPKVTYYFGHLLVEMCNFEIKLVTGKYAKNVDKYRDQIEKSWNSVLRIREHIDAYVDKKYLADHPLCKSLRHTQKFVAILMDDWLRPFKSRPKSVQNLSDQAKANAKEGRLRQAYGCVNKIARTYAYFPEECLDLEMHKNLKTANGETFLIQAVENSLIPGKGNEPRTWSRFYADWKTAQDVAIAREIEMARGDPMAIATESSNEKEPSKHHHHHHHVKEAMKSLATRVKHPVHHSEKLSKSKMPGDVEPAKKASPSTVKAPSSGGASKTPSKAKPSTTSKPSKPDERSGRTGKLKTAVESSALGRGRSKSPRKEKKKSFKKEKEEEMPLLG